MVEDWAAAGMIREDVVTGGGEAGAGVVATLVGKAVAGVGEGASVGVVVAVVEGKVVAGRGLGCGLEKEAWG